MSTGKPCFAAASFKPKQQSQTLMLTRVMPLLKLLELEYQKGRTWLDTYLFLNMDKSCLNLYQRNPPTATWLSGHMYWGLCLKLPIAEQACHQKYRPQTQHMLTCTVYLTLHPNLFSEQRHPLWHNPVLWFYSFKNITRHISEGFNSLCANKDHITFSNGVQHAHKPLKFYRWITCTISNDTT